MNLKTDHQVRGTTTTKKNEKSEDSLRDLQVSTKQINIYIIDVSEAKGKKWFHTQIQEAQKTLATINLKRLTPRHIIIKLSKIKDKELWNLPGKSDSSHTRDITQDYHRIS